MHVLHTWYVWYMRIHDKWVVPVHNTNDVRDVWWTTCGVVNVVCVCRCVCKFVCMCVHMCVCDNVELFGTVTT